MYTFISATKTIPTYANSYFLTIPPVKKYVNPWIFFFNFFSAKWSLAKVRKSHKVSGPYDKSLRNTLSLGLIGLMNKSIHIYIYIYIYVCVYIYIYIYILYIITSSNIVQNQHPPLKLSQALRTLFFRREYELEHLTEAQI